MRLEVSGDLAFVGAGGLHIIDVSDPRDPTLLGSHEEGRLGGGVAVSWPYAFLVANGYYELGSARMWVIDISNPAQPLRAGAFPLQGVYGWNNGSASIAIVGGHAFVADEAGLKVFDISHAALPTRASQYSGSALTYSVAVDDEHAYILRHSNLGVEIVDVSNRSNPSRVGVLPTGSADAMEVSVAGDFAYVGTHGAEVLVFDVTNPADPVRVNTINTGNNGSRHAVSGGFAYVAAGMEGLKTFDVRTPSNIRQVSTLGVPAGQIAASGTHVYLYADGLRVIDVTDPAQPRLVGALSPDDNNGPFGVYANDMDAAGHYVYVGFRSEVRGGRLEMEIIDVSDPARPERVGEYRKLQYGWGLESIEVIGNYAYLSSLDHGLEVINVSDPSNPRRSGGNSAFRGHDVTVHGEFVYIAAGDDGLIIVNRFSDLQFGPPMVANDGSLQLRLTGLNGQHARIQRSPNLRDWEDWVVVPVGEQPTEVADPDARSRAQRFYRAVPQTP
jgi:hypothetical protein